MYIHVVQSYGPVILSSPPTSYTTTVTPAALPLLLLCFSPCPPIAFPSYPMVPTYSCVAKPAILATGYLGARS